MCEEARSHSSMASLDVCTGREQAETSLRWAILEEGGLHRDIQDHLRLVAKVVRTWWKAHELGMIEEGGIGIGACSQAPSHSREREARNTSQAGG
jgi:hypothetical protein